MTNRSVVHKDVPAQRQASDAIQRDDEQFAPAIDPAIALDPGTTPPPNNPTSQSLRQMGLQQQQRQIGNAAIARMLAQRNVHILNTTSEAPLQRTLIDDFVMGATNLYHDVAEGIGLESHDEAEAARLQAFIDHGIFGPQSLVPPTNIGGFDASYDPASGVLFIKVSSGVNFVHGLTIDASNVITANHSDLAKAATDGMNLAPADRAAFVADFTWTTAQEDNFLSLMQSRVESAWGAQFSFSCTKPGWETLTAEVVVSVNVHRGAAEATDHLQTTTYKVPDSGTYNVGAYVDSDRNSATNAQDQDPHNNEMVMSSTHVNPTPQDMSLLQKSVAFSKDSFTLNDTGQATLRAFAADFQDANLDLTNPVQIIGHSSSSGSEAHNLALAQKRIDAVKGYLSGLGFTGMTDRVTTQNMGETGADEDKSWQRVDLIVGSGEGQLVVNHEFGHVFGLDDEYSVNPGGSISGSGLPVGTVTGHDAMARAIGAPGSIAENNDNIMSLGNTVRPQHYATFGWALQQVTGINEWQVV
jgi:outer membrane protein OmpA-like peptidoglycan-associated protein